MQRERDGDPGAVAFADGLANVNRALIDAVADSRLTLANAESQRGAVVAERRAVAELERVDAASRRNVVCVIVGPGATTFDDGDTDCDATVSRGDTGPLHVPRWPHPRLPARTRGGAQRDAARPGGCRLH